MQRFFKVIIGAWALPEMAFFTPEAVLNRPASCKVSPATRWLEETERSTVSADVDTLVREVVTKLVLVTHYLETGPLMRPRPIVMSPRKPTTAIQSWSSPDKNHANPAGNFKLIHYPRLRWPFPCQVATYRVQSTS